MIKFIQKNKKGLLIIAAIILCWIGLSIINISTENMKAKLPMDGLSGTATLTTTDYKAVKAMALKCRVNGNDETRMYIGFAGKVIDGNSGIAKITAQVLTWIPSLLDGAKLTIILTVLAVAAGLIFSIFLALGKMSRVKFLNPICRAYIFFFRGTPLLMQLYFIYYALPQISDKFAIDNAFIAAFIAFSLNSAAYLAEIIRAAIESIDRGQFEACKALGMNYAQTMSVIIIPQSIRRLIPPVSNEFIMVLKDASLVSIIALVDLTKATRSISSSTGSALVYVPAMILYLIITYIFQVIFTKLEKKYSVYE